MNVTLLAIAGGAIILGLASYAGYLLLKLKKQKELQLQHQKLAIEKRNANIFESVHVLCLAGIQEQCDLSEISIRLYNIMDYVQGEERVDFEKEFKIISIQGNLMLSGKLSEGLNKIDASILPSGIYLLEVGNKTEKFIKN